MAERSSVQHRRRSIRIPGYDYSSPGAYFVTICTQGHDCLLGNVVDAHMHLNDAGRMVESSWRALPSRFRHVDVDAFTVMPNHVHGVILIGCGSESCVHPASDQDNRANTRFAPTGTRVAHCGGESCIRPADTGEHNPPAGGRPYGTKEGSLGRVIQAFKSVTTHEYADGVKGEGWKPFRRRLWQRNYYEHVIRDEADLNDIREYILGNPGCWGDDQYNPRNPGGAGETT